MIDDGSICDRDVTPLEPRWLPEQVLAFLMMGRTDIERENRRNQVRERKIK